MDLKKQASFNVCYFVLEREIKIFFPTKFFNLCPKFYEKCNKMGYLRSYSR